jgi:class 3 adenylate cyclase
MGKDIELAILFADVVGSTRLYEQMGDVRARDMVAMCVDVMSAATEQHHGTVIKTMGDGVMASFPTPDQALDAAAQMQKQIQTHSQLKCQGPVALRIGCQYGPVVLEDRDVFGATVHTASRAASEAKAGQIITTGATVEKLSPEWQSACRTVAVALLKGQTNRVTLCEVLWQKEDATSMVTALVVKAGPIVFKRLRLRVGSRDVLLDEQTPSVTIGRADDNDCVVKGNTISRLHARIEINRDKFVLTDLSTNGTFVQTLGGEESFIRRDSLQIKGEGMIGLGRIPEQDSGETICFVCEEP